MRNLAFVLALIMVVDSSAVALANPTRGGGGGGRPSGGGGGHSAPARSAPSRPAPSHAAPSRPAPSHAAPSRPAASHAAPSRPASRPVSRPASAPSHNVTRPTGGFQLGGDVKSSHKAPAAASRPATSHVAASHPNVPAKKPATSNVAASHPNVPAKKPATSNVAANHPNVPAKKPASTNAATKPATSNIAANHPNVGNGNGGSNHPNVGNGNAAANHPNVGNGSGNTVNHPNVGNGNNIGSGNNINHNNNVNVNRNPNVNVNTTTYPRYGNRPVVVNPVYTSGAAWGWNNGSAWYPANNYYGGGFWGALAIGATSAAIFGSIVAANNQKYTSYQVQPNSPGATLLSNYGLQQVQCGPSGLVNMYGPNDSVICANPNSNVEAGDYDIDSQTLSLVSR